MDGAVNIMQTDDLVLPRWTMTIIEVCLKYSKKSTSKAKIRIFKRNFVYTRTEFTYSIMHLDKREQEIESVVIINQTVV